MTEADIAYLREAAKYMHKGFSFMETKEGFSYWYEIYSLLRGLPENTILVPVLGLDIVAEKGYEQANKRAIALYLIGHLTFECLTEVPALITICDQLQGYK